MRISSMFPAAVLLLGASQTWAQSPAGLSTQSPATSGSTNVAQEGFQQAEQLAADADDVTELGISAGALLSLGNAQSISATGASKLKLRRGYNQLGAAASANFARAKVETDETSSTETTVENYQGNVRYDRFVSERMTVFLNVGARRDRFQGLDLRLNLDPGLSYYFLQQDKHQFWGELGYDLQHDVRRDESIVDDEGDKTQDKTDTRHNGRLFLGYDNKLNEAVSFGTGVEYLQSVTDTKFWRLNYDAALSSNIADSFSVALTFSLKYDNEPLPGVEKTDAVTAVNLVYNLL